MTDPTNFDREMFRISINDGKSMAATTTEAKAELTFLSFVLL